jgi:hypothetical protein
MISKIQRQLEMSRRAVDLLRKGGALIKALEWDGGEDFETWGIDHIDYVLSQPWDGDDASDSHARLLPSLLYLITQWRVKHSADQENVPEKVLDWFLKLSDEDQTQLMEQAFPGHPRQEGSGRESWTWAPAAFWP